jgi:hypothetical protein
MDTIYYIEFLNKDKGFKVDRVNFTGHEAYEDCVRSILLKIHIMFVQSLEIIIITCGIICSVAVIMILRERWFGNQTSSLTLGQIPISRTELGKLVIDWCHENLGYDKTRKPSLSIRYYRTKKVEGLYFSQKNECVVYTYLDLQLIEFINTTIHEYCHARQKCRGFDKQYDRYDSIVGYEQNPFEIEARNVSKKFERDCYSWVCQQIKLLE